MSSKLARNPLKRSNVKMSDIARIAGVSASTVSRSLAGNPVIPQATRDAIEAIAHEHGYVINRSARNLRQSETQTIAVAVPLGHESEQLISDPFFLRLFGHIADEISQRGYDILLVREPSPDALWLNRLIRSQRADGFIIAGQSDQHAALNLAAQSFSPMVVFGAQLPDQLYCSVGSDDFTGGLIATHHLLRSGRQRIMFLGPATLPQIDMRLAGCREALRQHGSDLNDLLVLSTHFTDGSAYEEMQMALARKLSFDAVFAASDRIALSAVRAIEAAGRRCPEDIAVVGFDDIDVATQSRPMLTTVRQNFTGLANRLVELLFRRMRGEQTRSDTLPVELIIRESAPSL